MTDQPVNPSLPVEAVKPPLPDPNPLTRLAHRQQSFWQIKLPIAICIALVSISGLMVLIFGFGKGGSLSSLSDISVIWLIVPMLILGSILIAVQIAVIYLLFRFMPIIPGNSRKVQDFFVLLSVQVRKISDKSTAPFVRIHSMTASLGAFRRSVRQSFQRSRDK